jgi:hypothetical protein
MSVRVDIPRRDSLAPNGNDHANGTVSSGKVTLVEVDATTLYRVNLVYSAIKTPNAMENQRTLDPCLTLKNCRWVYVVLLIPI